MCGVPTPRIPNAGQNIVINTRLEVNCPNEPIRDYFHDGVKRLKTPLRIPFSFAAQSRLLSTPFHRPKTSSKPPLQERQRRRQLRGRAKIQTTPGNGCSSLNRRSARHPTVPSKPPAASEATESTPRNPGSALRPRLVINPAPVRARNDASRQPGRRDKYGRARPTPGRRVVAGPPRRRQAPAGARQVREGLVETQARAGRSGPVLLQIWLPWRNARCFWIE